MAQNVSHITLCNLFLYQVQDISLSELHQKSGNVIDAISSYLDDGTKDSTKLHFYKMDSSNILKSIKSYNDITSASGSKINIIAVDLFQLGQSCLNENSFNSSESITERHKALKLFSQFVERIPNSEKLRGDMAKDCLHSGYIEKNLTSKTSHDPCKDVPLGDLHLSDSGVRDTVVLDNLISVCKSLNQQACKYMHDEIKLYSWAEIVVKGDVITRTVQDKNIPYEITLPSDVFELVRDKYNVDKLHVDGELEFLGEGGFGTTYKYTTRQITLVIKQSRLQELFRFDSKPGWYREGLHTERLAHENVIKYYGKPILYRENCYAVMEFGGTALDAVYRDNKEVAPKDIRQAMLQISSAIDYLHRLVIIHRDIRTANVTVSNSGVYKLIDFGLSSEKTELDSRFRSITDFGNHLWKSPEYCAYINDTENNEAPGRSSDIWMYGVFVLEMLTFPDIPQFFKDYRKHQDEFRKCLADKTINFHDYIDNNWDSKIREIMLLCLEFDEGKRVVSKGLLELCKKLEQPGV